VHISGHLFRELFVGQLRTLRRRNVTDLHTPFDNALSILIGHQRCRISAAGPTILISGRGTE
jgi:hypothetical protein